MNKDQKKRASDRVKKRKTEKRRIQRKPSRPEQPAIVKKGRQRN